ncbi:MAG: diguanylate cyclase [Ruminiclostridium sp.]|nr:diguanylate cyclase [Ruminiclostridium sp.]
MNYAFCELSEITFQDLRSLSFESLLYCIKNELFKQALANYKGIYNGSSIQKPIMFSSKKGVKWVELYKTSIDYKSKKADCIAFLDVTEKVKSEKDLRYVAYHDKLTGLYNRSFFEEEVQRIDVNRSLPISIIIADLNGLKLTNDVFGHYAGDKLLISAADVLRNVCRKEDIISRWGGDEFAILLPETDSESAANICERIVAECEKDKKEPITVSMSVGYATKSKESENLNDVFKMSENMMYRKKLGESRKIRNVILDSLKESLFKRSLESEEHIKRVVLLTKSFAGCLDLSEQDMGELSLLSFLHDIGKVAIDDQILKKTGKLNTEEWAQIMMHPEKGYKIAVNHQELAHISDGILCHHERWDGKGYPQGLKEKDIPRISRILNIVDAYDIMTHKTIYKNPVTHTDALVEIERCSGKQFDPFYANAFIKFLNNNKP